MRLPYSRIRLVKIGFRPQVLSRPKIRKLSAGSDETTYGAKYTVSSFPILTEAVKSRDYELITKIIFEQDPFEVKRVQMPMQTARDSPNLVASESDTRMVGCICEPEAEAINWMELKKGDPIQCYCGHWFQLVSYEEYFHRTT